MGKMQASDCQRLNVPTAQEVINNDNQSRCICLLGFLSLLTSEF